MYVFCGEVKLLVSLYLEWRALSLCANRTFIMLCTVRTGLDFCKEVLGDHLFQGMSKIHGCPIYKDKASLTGNCVGSVFLINETIYQLQEKDENGLRPLMNH